MVSKWNEATSCQNIFICHLWTIKMQISLGITVVAHCLDSMITIELRCRRNPKAFAAPVAKHTGSSLTWLQFSRLWLKSLTNPSGLQHAHWQMSCCMTKPTKRMCAQQRLRSAWASAQSYQSLHCPHEETLGTLLPIERTVKTLIRLGGCPGWSESSLGACVILLVLSCSCSILLKLQFGCQSNPALEVNF